MNHSLTDAWYKGSSWLGLLKPLSSIYRVISQRRRRQYLNGSKLTYRASIPVIVVGNITVGGTGKTPLIIYLALQLKKAGFKPGIVSRGYQSKAQAYPYVVTSESSPVEAGDEALLIARNTHCPVIIDANRVMALKAIEQEFDCDVVLSDDGLQHYAMGRDIEIALVDGARGFGNGCLLPQGPLREKPQRLTEVDYLVCNGPTKFKFPANTITMELKSTWLGHLKTAEKRSLAAVGSDGNKKKVHALAGIGNPARFFNSLCACGFDIITHVFKDHHAFTEQDITFNDDLDVVMTEKDAIKCLDFAGDQHWYLKVEAALDDSFMESIFQQLTSLTNKKN